LFRSLPRRIALAYGLLISAALAALAALAAQDPGEITRYGLLVGLGAVVASSILAHLLTFPRLRTLRRLTEAALAMARGRFDQRVAGEAPDEVGELSYAFNRMAEAVGELVARLSQEHSRMVAAYESSSNALVAVTADRMVAYVNPAAAQLFTTEPQEALGRPFLHLVRDHELHLLLERCLEEGKKQDRLVEFGPARRQLQVVIFPIVGGGDWAALAVFTDVTEARRLELMRREFVGNVSHELRTPLATIKAAVETLQAGALAEPALAQEFLGRIDAEVDRLTRMVEELLELYRLESGAALNLAPVDLPALLEGAVRRMAPMAQRQGLTLSLEVAPDLPPLLADGERLQRAIINLIHNAIKFTLPGGRVWVRASREGRGLAIRVTDTGIGIAPEDLPRVFERFYKADRSRSGEGIGLGLAIVKHTVQAHGGQVAVESALGQGSTFTILLPLRPPA